MPILVRWKWKEHTKSFLVIFHFTDDYTRTNLRMKYFGLSPRDKEEFRSRFGEKRLKDMLKHQGKAMLTWAPSHPEVGMLGEILRYSNLINGLKEFEKRKLKDKLQGTKLKWGEEGEKGQVLGKDIKNMFKQTGIEYMFAKPDPETNEWQFMFELRPEYIDYLKTTLKPYLRK